MKPFTKDLNRTDVRYTLKHVFCHDPACWSCAQGKGHGPYWHATFEEKGQVHSVILGEGFNPFELDSEQKTDHASSNAQAQSSDSDSKSNRAEHRFDFTGKTPRFPNNASIDIKAIQQDDRESASCCPLPPTRFDFERDMRRLKQTLRPESLKSIYRELTKKYHPDKYPGISHITSWMAEINGQYSQIKKTFRC